MCIRDRAQTYQEFLRHCRSWDHRQQCSQDDPLPKYLVDPRHSSSYLSENNETRCKVLWGYRRFVLAALRAPMDAAGKKRMQLIAEIALEAVRDREDDRSYHETDEQIATAIGRCTPQIAAATCVELAVEDFLAEGIMPGFYTYGVLMNGWDKFDPYQLRGDISGLEFCRAC
eukprot:TRINITY_DN39607_c0_g1_i2.p1 TRINITY_DN39607_c0_g1~~TRINITY_DN39607_c0_g1_i2.p1  ORF type:complete len:172 (-),score=29.67 TRINITY_DN39607_c0_g1_i2:319-834(-)